MQVLLAVPRLRRLELAVNHKIRSSTDMQPLIELLGNDSVCKPLHAVTLAINAEGLFSHAPWDALGAVLWEHLPLQGIELLGNVRGWGWPAGRPNALTLLLGALVAAEAVVPPTRALARLHFQHCQLTADGLHLLAQLLRGNRIAELCMCAYLEDDAWRDSADAFCAALRGCSSLTSLDIQANMSSASEPLIEALCGHPTLRTLSVCSCLVPRGESYAHVQPEAATSQRVSQQLAAVLSSNAPALRELLVMENLDGDGLVTLFAALPRNTHLEHFTFPKEHLSAEQARDTLLPAVQAAPALRQLRGYRSNFAPRNRPDARAMWAVLEEANIILKSRA
jgi:hypothetical protein